MDIPSVDIPVDCCPACGYVFEQASCGSKPGATPIPDDFTLCLNCGELLVFTDDLHQRLPSPDEFRKAQENKALSKVQKMIKQRGLIHDRAAAN